MECIITFTNVIKTYQMGQVSINAMDGVNFSIDRGELVIIVGPSGAGKSTILNILGGMDTATSGEVTVDCKRIDQMNRTQLIEYRRFDIGFVFQFYNLMPNLTALENVELATQISEKPLDPYKTLESVGLSNRINNFPSQLSGGEQQRVAIARALAKNPKILLCDEPTGALDYATSKEILTLLQQTCRNVGTPVIIVTHNVLLSPMADSVIRVKNGKVTETFKNEKRVLVEDIDW